MKYEVILLIVLAIVMLFGLLAHFAYLQRIKAKLATTAKSSFRMKELKRALQVRQGSNYNTLVLSSWSLFFVALVFLYFLTPRVFPSWNFFNFPKVASNELGFFILALIVIIVTSFIAFSVPLNYRYYTFSKSLKNLTIYGVPLILLVSLISSSYLATIFPLTSNFAWNLGFVALAAAEILLLLPMFNGFLEVLR